MGLYYAGGSSASVLAALVGQNPVVASLQTTSSIPGFAGGPYAANTYLGARFTNYGTLWLGVAPLGSNYAISSSNAGDTTINGTSSTPISFCYNNGVIGTLGAGGSLTVTDYIKAQGANGVLSDGGLFQASGTNTKVVLYGNVADGGSAVNAVIDTSVALTTTGAKILSVRNNGTEKSYIDKDGKFSTVGGLSADGGAFQATSSEIFCGQINTTGLIISTSGTQLTLTGQIADSASSVPVRVGPFTAYSTAGAHLVDFINGFGGLTMANIDKDGAIQLNQGGAAKPTADSSQRGKIWVEQGGGGSADVMYVCLKAAGGTYSWKTIATG